MSEQLSLKNQISTLLREAGFDAFGFCDAHPLDAERDHLTAWLQKNFQGTMHYMNHHLEKRLSPELLVPHAKTVIVAAYNYFSTTAFSQQKYQLSKFALGKDYHSVIKNKLYQVVEANESLRRDASLRVFVDSAPLLERALAVKAGVGFIGKNGCLIIPKKGSYFFLGEIVTSLELEPDSSMSSSFCGTCQRCLDACPTHALLEPKLLDARKCNAYLTIEYQEEKFQNEPVGNSIFGCDVCQDVCPHNRFAQKHSETDFLPKPELLSMTSEDWEQLTPEKFDQLFENSAVKRIGPKGLQRNIQQVTARHLLF
ncbi:MAG: tRNA epoxyqueuosine(34) reductase QueG [Bacteroidales bacterium]|nr:tRNA epoxyqueuosine(34) reductase QueG [Bacteroidales bacterium]